ncbi:DUF7133 domain-containing protein, partial [Snuella sedimenti]
AYVNRGYAKGVLDKDSLLVNVTAACGPTIYRGGLFPKGYEENAFVCVPEANLVKRNILEFYGDSIAARQAWEGKEFLASTDEGFRPVNLNTGPDGSLYVVDMHRGVIQHQAYLSPYLKKKAIEKQLDTIINAGRILKIKNQLVEPYTVPDIEALKAEQLVALLKHKNGWIRDRAQHHIVYKEEKNVIPQLRLLAKELKDPLGQIHALYTLKGLGALTFDLLVEVAEKGTPEVTSHSLILLEAFALKENVNSIKVLFDVLMKKHDKSIDLYLGSTVGVWMAVSKDTFFPLLKSLIQEYKTNPRMVEAILSGLSESSQTFKLSLQQDRTLIKSDFYEHLEEVVKQEVSNKVNWIFTKTSVREDSRTKGAKLFRQMCSACHGMDGEGIEGLAPPLMHSEFVSKPIERLGLIILHGLEGPVHVNGKLYELGLVMPGLIHNQNISDEDIADIISYVNNAFSAKPQSLSTNEVKVLRSKKPKSGNEYTEQELIDYVNKK